MKTAALFVAALALAGCTSGMLPAPVTPTPEEVAANTAALVAAAPDPQTYFLSSADLSVRRCHIWLDAQVVRQNQLSTAGTIAGIGGTAASAGLGLAGAGVPAVAGAALGTGLVQGIISAQAGATGITSPVETGMVIEPMQDAFLAAVPMLTSVPLADIYADRFAGICSQRNAQAIQAEALMMAAGMVVAVPTVPTIPVAVPSAPVVVTPVPPVTTPPVVVPPIVVPPASPGGPIFPSVRRQRQVQRAPDPRRFDTVNLSQLQIVPPPIITIRRSAME